MSPGRSLLIVDDEPSLLSLLTLVFQSEGFAVLTARSGAEALQMFSAQRPDVVILDFLMPEMDGGQLAEQMRSLRPDVPLVMLSACLTVPDAVHQRVDAFVEKGAGTEQLLRTVQEILRRSAGGSGSNP